MLGTLSKLKNYALLAALGIILCLAAFVLLQGRKLKAETERADRLENNQSALLSDLHTETNRAGNLQAAVDALTLKTSELERLLPEYERKLADMKIRVKNAEHIAQVQTELAASVTARRDTVYEYIERPGPGRSRFTYSDAWLTAVIDVEEDSVASLSLSAKDSLTLVAHKQRRKCLFKKPGPTRYTVESVSPYTTITGMKVVEIFD